MNESGLDWEAPPYSEFERILLVGTGDAAGLPTASARVRRVADCDLVRGGRLPVEATIAWATSHRNKGGRLLILTDHDLTIPECSVLFGFSDPRSNVAIVSTFRLCADGDPERWPLRVRNEIAHELGHLQGLKHCSEPGCLMRPVVHPSELDVRSNEPCGRCPRSLTRRIAQRFRRRVSV